MAITNIALSATSIKEENLIGDTIGTLSATGGTGTVSYSFVVGYDEASFTIYSNAYLRAAVVFDYETKSSYTIKVRATDSIGYYDKTFTITISDILEITTLDINLNNSQYAYLKSKLINEYDYLSTVNNWDYYRIITDEYMNSYTYLYEIFVRVPKKCKDFI